MSKDLTRRPSSELAAKASGSLTQPSRGGKSIAIIQAPLRPYAEVFDTANICDRLSKQRFVKTDAYKEPEYLPSLEFGSRMMQNMAPEHVAKIIDKAKTIRRLLFPFAIKMKVALDQFAEFVDPDPENYIDPAQASVMVHGLVDAIAGKKRSDEDQAKLAGMLLMFDPTINAIGSATNLWGEVPQSPVPIALAILSMMFKTQTFCPAPAELAQACRHAHGRLRRQHLNMKDLMKQLGYAEEIVFDYDREEWTKTTKENFETVQGIVWDLYDKTDGKKADEMCDALTEIENEMIREIVGRNGNTHIVKGEVQRGEPVPDGVTLQPIPDELIKKLPHSELTQKSRYFLTAQQIAIVCGNKVEDIIKRAA